MFRSLSAVPYLLAIALLLVSPVTAGLVLSNVAFTPDAPLVRGGQQQVVATYAIIPAGSTTFAPGHSLQMQTNLTGALWTVQVTLDGRDAARQTASGSAAFVNGEILSYPTNRDVGIVVTVDGTVPAGTAGSLAVLTIKELDNSGNAVPGSDLVVSQPVAGPSSPVVTPVMPTLTPVLVTTTQPPKSPGFAAPCAIVVFLITAIALRASCRDR